MLLVKKTNVNSKNKQDPQPNHRGGVKLNKGQIYVYNTIIKVVLSLIKDRLTYIIPSERWF